MSDEWHSWEQPWALHPNPVSLPSPYRHERVWITRQNGDAPRVVNPRDLHPATNIYGLFWRPVEKPQLESTPPKETE